MLSTTQCSVMFLLLMTMTVLANATVSAIANLLNAGGESPFADSECICGISKCQKKDSCPWLGRREQSVNKFQREGLLELVYDYNDEMRASKCNVDKTCCPKGIPQGVCRPGCHLTYDPAICNTVLINEREKSNSYGGYGQTKHCYGTPEHLPCCDCRPYVCPEDCDTCSQPRLELVMQGFCGDTYGEKIPAPCCQAPPPKYKASYKQPKPSYSEPKPSYGSNRRNSQPGLRRICRPIRSTRSSAVDRPEIPQ